MERFRQEKLKTRDDSPSPELASVLSKVSPNFEHLSETEQMSTLRALLSEFGQTVGDTSQPVDNSVGHMAEEAAFRLNKLESETGAVPA